MFSAQNYFVTFPRLLGEGGVMGVALVEEEGEEEE